MENESSNTVRDVVANVLQNAGVRPADIDIPSETGKAPGSPSLDGLPKGQTVGEELEVEDTETSDTETVESSKPESDESVVQPVSHADMETAINLASSKFQSIMDKKVNELTYQMTQTVGALNQFFQSQEDSNIAGLPADEQLAKRVERLEKPTQPRIQIAQQPQQPQTTATYYQGLVDTLDAFGIKVDDPRIDWGKNEQSFEAGSALFKTSIAKIMADQIKSQIETLRKNGQKEITKIRKKTGVDKVSVKGPGGEGLPNMKDMTPAQKIEYGFKVQEELKQTSQ